MNGASHVLVFHLHDIEQLHGIFGERAMTEALDDMTRALERLAPRVRGRHAYAPLPAPSRRDRWTCGIAMRGIGTLPIDAAEQEESLAAAARLAIGEALLDVFGGGTGGKLRFTTLMLPLPDLQPLHLDAWIDGALQSALEPGRNESCEACGDLEGIITGDGIRTFLQPIVALPSGDVVGYEALSRGPEGSELETAPALFGAAARCGRSIELELACARRALRLVPSLPGAQWMSVNVGLETFATQQAEALFNDPRVAVEITEHLPLDRADVHRPLFASMRERGVSIVLDDTGCGFADTHAVSAIRPDIAKLCITITRNAGRGERFMKEISECIAEFRSLGANVLAEGVETREQAEAMAAAGATLAQGWYFGRPVLADSMFALR